MTDGTLLVQQFLRAHGVVELCGQFGIKATRHGTFPRLVLLKYGQVDSPMGEPIVQECRGLILDETTNWSVICHPYHKFFNYGEGHAASIDWASARVYEKVDGSIMTLYFYRGKWQVSSSGVPDASGPVARGESRTFADLFWSTWDRLGYLLPTDTDCCFMFELMSAENRVVVVHPESRLVLHGARNIPTGQEMFPEVAAMPGWAVVQSYPLDSLESVIEAAGALNAMEAEGFVVCDRHFNRIKVKSPQYLALAHMKDQFSQRRMIELVRTNEGDEFLAYFPEMRELYESVDEAYRELVTRVNTTYGNVAGALDQKSFALLAKEYPYSAILFAMRCGKVRNPGDFLQTAHIRLVEKLLGLDAPMACVWETTND